MVLPYKVYLKYSNFFPVVVCARRLHVIVGGANNEWYMTQATPHSPVENR